MLDRTHKAVWAIADIAEIAKTYHAWRGEAVPAVAELARVQASAEESPNSGDSGYVGEEKGTVKNVRMRRVSSIMRSIAGTLARGSSAKTKTTTPSFKSWAKVCRSTT